MKYSGVKKWYIPINIFFAGFLVLLLYQQGVHQNRQDLEERAIKFHGTTAELKLLMKAHRQRKRSTSLSDSKKEQATVESFVNMSDDNRETVLENEAKRLQHYNRTWISQDVINKFYLPHEVVKNVKYFLFFVGHGRGGSSIVGSLIDAHPNMVVATDYALFSKWLEDVEFHRNSSALYTALFARSRKVTQQYRQKEQRGYSLYIKKSFMGRYKDHISVIGEKEAGSATTTYMRDQKLWYDIYNDIHHTTGLPIKVVQVVRNPFDNIATMTLFLAGGSEYRKKYVTEEGGQMNNSELLDFRIKAYFRNCRAVYDMQRDEQLNINLHQVHLQDLVQKPTEEIEKLCNFFSVQCPKWYVNTCEKHIFKALSRTRDKVVWSRNQIDHVNQQISEIPWLTRYTFTSD